MSKNKELSQTIKVIPTPDPRIIPLVIKSPATLLEAQLLNIRPALINVEPSTPEFRVPIRRIIRLLRTAPNETPEIAVDPMKANVESAARFSDTRRAWITPHEYVIPMKKNLHSW